jgi:hypothetical protein
MDRFFEHQIGMANETMVFDTRCDSISKSQRRQRGHDLRQRGFEVKEFIAIYITLTIAAFLRFEVMTGVNIFERVRSSEILLSY